MPSPTGPPSVNLELRDYLAVLRRRKLLIALITVVAVVGTFTYSLTREKVYEARGAVVIQVNPGDLMIVGQSLKPDAADLQAELEVMSGFNTQVAIAQTLGYQPKVSLRTGTGAPAIFVTSRNADPARAAKEATDFATTYIAQRRLQIAKDYNTAITDLQTQLAALDLQTAFSRQRILDIEKELETTTDGAKRLQLTAEHDRLLSDVDASTVATRQSTVQDQIQQLQVASSAAKSRGRYVLSAATPPSAPVSPKPTRDAMLALVFGLLIGLAVAFLRDYFDDTFRTKEDLDAVAGGVPVLGIVPAISDWRDRKTAVLESVTHPSSAAAEAYRSLRTSLEFLGIDRKIHIIHITSSASGEGKSTTSANLAVSLARAGKHVVLVDCDLRRPRMHEFFGMDNSVGFTSIILGTASIDEALVPAPGIPGLMILASGPTPPNPSELLSTKTAQSKLEALARSADYVVVDSPPLLPVSDSVILARYAHATLLVVTARSTTRRALARSLELLHQVDAPLEGIVFNGVAQAATYGYGYGYGYAYGYGGSSRNPAERSGSDRSVNGASMPSREPVESDNR